jgi:hypothetical protein
LFCNYYYFVILIFVFYYKLKIYIISEMESVSICGLGHISTMFATSLKI